MTARFCVCAFKIADSSVVVLLQPTSLHPERALLIRSELADCTLPTISVDRYPDRWHPYYTIDPRYVRHAQPTYRQSLPVMYRANGLFYLISGRSARLGTWWDDNPRFVETPGVINIDTPEDWAEAERVYGRGL